MSVYGLSESTQKSTRSLRIYIGRIRYNMRLIVIKGVVEFSHSCGYQMEYMFMFISLFCV